MLSDRILQQSVFDYHTVYACLFQTPHLIYLVPGGLRTPLGRHYERPARSWLTSGRGQKWSDEKRGPRTEIAAVERREARRSWTGDLRRNGDRPDREAGHQVRRSAPAPSRRSAPLAS